MTTKKLEFVWELRLSNNKKELEVWLNGNVTKIITIEHKDFYMNVANTLTEINVFQFVHGTETKITLKSFNELKESYSIHEKFKKSV